MKIDLFKTVAKATEAKGLPPLRAVHAYDDILFASNLDMSISAPRSPEYTAGVSYDKKGFALDSHNTLEDFGYSGLSLGFDGEAHPVGNLPALLKKVAHAMSNEATRYYLRGVYIESIDGLMKLTAVDGHRLATLETTTPLPEMPGIIIPREAISVIVAWKSGDWTFKSDGDYIVEFKEATTGLVVRTKLIDGSFPDYKRVIPKTSALIGNAPAKELCKECKSTYGYFKSKRARAVRFYSEVATAKCDGKADYVGLTSLTLNESCDYFSVNPTYLADAANVADKGDTLHFYQEGEQRPIRIDGTDGLTQVIMPLRT